MFLYVILLIVKCQCKFYSKLNFPKLFGNTGIHHIGAPDNLIVFIVFQQFGVIS